MKHKYLFDVKLFASIAIEAETEEQARAELERLIDGAEANFGAYPDGSPIVATVSMDDEDDEILEIDGEPV